MLRFMAAARYPVARSGQRSRVTLAGREGNASPMSVSPLLASTRARAVCLPTIAGLFVGMLTSCARQRADPEQPAPQPAKEEISAGRCVLFAGVERDPTLLGLPRSEPPSCCESGYGFDPQLAARSCDFAEYLGESEELACVHRFIDRHGALQELRVTPIIGLEFEAAIALHESGEFDETHVAGWLANRTDAWLSQSAVRQWALLGGWSATRRLTWTAEACDVDAMQPVLIAMASAPEQDDVHTPLPRFEFGESPTVPASLLDRHAASISTPAQHSLPEHATALIEATLHAAANERLEDFVAQIDPGARWGLPDRRELAGRPIFDDGGLAAMSALRRVTSRLPENLSLHCPKLDRRTIPLVRRGEATMWCMWTSDDHLDMLVFALRGASIVYMGLFPDAPRGPLNMPGEPPPPPARARPPIICGDPHAVDYPGLCSAYETVLEDDDESDDQDDQPPDESDSASGEGGESSSSESR